jgi:hypothetical protein
MPGFWNWNGSALSISYAFAVGLVLRRERAVESTKSCPSTFGSTSRTLNDVHFGQRLSLPRAQATHPFFLRGCE